MKYKQPGVYGVLPPFLPNTPTLVTRNKNTATQENGGREGFENDLLISAWRGWLG